MSSRFHLIPERYGQTDRRTDRQTDRIAISRVSVLTRGKTGQIFVRQSVRPSGINIFKTIRLRDRWADVDEAWHVHSVRLRTQLLGSGI